MPPRVPGGKLAPKPSITATASLLLRQLSIFTLAVRPLLYRKPPPGWKLYDYQSICRLTGLLCGVPKAKRRMTGLRILIASVNTRPEAVQVFEHNSMLILM